ncbi:glucosaminidase domain-containing protein [uncultured Desulfuromusa sp.]|uniref:glucosaminidase domain-containing protein n=1 Tax=uncultured Desulfuromusa sp. TaxID=219183 RepID=UPI002AA6F86B|nr:glucosaminidase domain-containing protein [uncultured Desulfuromusa sp.]
MKRYPFLSMLLIAVFFALLSASVIWFQSDTQVQTTKKPEQIVPDISVEEKKAQFKATIVPAVNEVYNELLQQYQDVSERVRTDGDSDDLAALRQLYKAANNEELLIALKPHPQSIALAQAALESSWATSRFFKEANNVFGIWSFKKDEPRIPAAKTRGDKTIWVKKYDSVKDSIRGYYRTLARGDAYAEFRTLKMETDNPYELVKKLDSYSEKGAEYGEELSAIIRFNNFEEYDQPTIKL